MKHFLGFYFETAASMGGRESTTLPVRLQKSVLTSLRLHFSLLRQLQGRDVYAARSIAAWPDVHGMPYDPKPNSHDGETLIVDALCGLGI